MDRNVESHFSQLPSADIRRSIIPRSSSHKTTFNFGDLIPIYLDEILPGDSVRISTTKVVRLQTLLTPIMDNAYLDTYWFFVPHRLVWSHFKEFCGENTQSAWAPSTTYSMPKIKSPSGGWASGTIADYFGIPVGVNFTASGTSPNLDYSHFPTSLPFRSYALICNEFFRDQNLTDPLNIPLGDATQSGSNGGSYINDVANGGKPFKVAKYHDEFTSCLPQPQKGNAINVPLPEFEGGTFPVYSGLVNTGLYDWTSSNTFPMKAYLGTYSSDTGKYTLDEGFSSSRWFNAENGTTYHNARFTPTTSPTNGEKYIFPSNLHVTIPGSSLSSLTINDLRLAFQAQKYLERNARSGSRYIELIKAHFGVSSPDARLQRPEYLGGNRIPLSIHQVTNNAQGEQDFLGDLGAMSFTHDKHADFEHSFTEHGYLICLCCARYDHTYAQGLDRLWTRNNFTDFYLPVFANIGEQPVLTDRIYCDGRAPDVFGYQEAWSEYRYKANRVSGEMRPGISNTLASWHLADYYSSKPTLSDSWIREDKTNVDRVLAVTSAVSNQVLADFHFDAVYTRPMPLYSIPGAIDHN